MNKEFIPYEEALALKALGFETFNSFGDYFKFEDGETILDTDDDRDRIITDNEDKDIKQIAAPLYQQAFRWFREKHDLFGEINLTTKQEEVKEFEFFVLNIDEPLFESDDYKTYEEAELACLKKLIEIVKNKKL